MPQEADFSADPSSVAVDPAPKNKRKKAEEIPEGYEKVRTRIRPVKDDEGNGHSKETQPSLGRGTPFDTSAALEQAMIEVIRVGPGKGSGWQGQLFNGQAVTYARCGQLPNSRDLFDKAAQLFGGGEYEFQGKDEAGKAVSTRKTFPGAPLPISDADVQQMGNSFEDLQWQSQGFQGQGQGAAGTVDEEGFWQGSAQDQGDTGWIYVAARNNWKWTGPGRPLGPPPSLPGSNANFYDPGMYDHREKKEDPELKELKEIVKLLVTKMDQPKSNPMDDFFRLQQLKIEDDRLRWEQEKDAREAARAAERAERFEQLKLAAKAEEAKANASIKIAEFQAAAAKDAAIASSSTAERMANFQTASNDKMMAMVMQKGDSLGELDRLSEVAERIFSAKNQPLSGAAEAAAAIRDTVPAVTQGVVDVMSLWHLGKGQSLPQSDEGEGPQGQGPTTSTDIQEQAKYFSLYGSLIKFCQRQLPPASMPAALGNACITADLDDQFLAIRDTLIQATPEVLIMSLKAQVRKLGLAEKAKPQVDAAQALLLSPEGKAWWNAMRSELAKSKAEDEAEDRQLAMQQQQKQLATKAPPVPSTTPMHSTEPRQKESRG